MYKYIQNFHINFLVPDSPVQASCSRNFSLVMRVDLISLLLTLDGPSVGSNCQHNGRGSSSLHIPLKIIYTKFTLCVLLYSTCTLQLHVLHTD